VTENDLKRLQDHFIETSKTLLLAQHRLQPVGFVVTLRKHVDKLLGDGIGLEFLDPATDLVSDPNDDKVAILIVDLLMSPKKLYHAVMALVPDETRKALSQMVDLAKSIKVDDPYLRVMRPFLQRAQANEKDIMGATMRHVCDKVDAFASIFHCEAWMRLGAIEPAELEKAEKHGLSGDLKAIEALYSSMETYNLSRAITLPIRREPSPGKRDGGAVLGFGDPHETLAATDGDLVMGGRLQGFLKPLPEAS